jgi:hypothetical protein
LQGIKSYEGPASQEKGLSDHPVWATIFMDKLANKSFEHWYRVSGVAIFQRGIFSRPSLRPPSRRIQYVLLKLCIMVLLLTTMPGPVPSRHVIRTQFSPLLVPFLVRCFPVIVT